MYRPLKRPVNIPIFKLRLPTIGLVHMLGRGRKIIPQMRGAAGSQAQLPAAIGTMRVQMPCGTRGTERAFKRANVSPLRIGRQGSITTFTIWAHFQHDESLYGFGYSSIVMALCVYSSICIVCRQKNTGRIKRPVSLFKHRFIQPSLK